MEMMKILERLNETDSIDQLVELGERLKGLPIQEQARIRQYINTHRTTPYTAVTSILLDHPDPDYEQLIGQVKRGQRR